VNRLGAAGLSDFQDFVQVQIAIFGRRFSYPVGLVGHFDVKGVPVSVRVDGYCFYAQLAAGAYYSAGDFPAIGDQDFIKHESSSNCSEK
jgi:hypothetical protein